MILRGFLLSAVAAILLVGLAQRPTDGGQDQLSVSWLIASYLTLSVAPTGSVRGQETLRDQVRKHGNVEKVLIVEYAPVDLDKLVTDSELIVEGYVSTKKTSLTPDERSVYTNAEFQILQILKRPSAEDLSPEMSLLCDATAEW